MENPVSLLPDSQFLPRYHDQEQANEIAKRQKPLNDNILAIVRCAELAKGINSVGFAPGIYTVLPFGMATVLGPTTTVLPPVTTVSGGSTTVVAAGMTGIVEVPTTRADADG